MIPVIVTIFNLSASGQIKVRLFTEESPNSIVFTAIRSGYSLDPFFEKPVYLEAGEPVFISRMDNKLLVKPLKIKGFFCDSLVIAVKAGNGSFTLRTGGRAPVKRIYKGDIKLLSDLGTLLIINTCDVESYVAGVVRAESGPGQNIEYIKTQAIIARTYMYKNFNKHLTDGFNLCDDTHCQAYKGITDDTVICRASKATAGLVILGPDSTLIIAAFHSNCGGETATSESVWLTDRPYLKSVSDPFCTESRNAKWQVKISRDEWRDYLKEMDYQEDLPDSEVINFSQEKRKEMFRTGSFSIPVSRIRSDFHLRSAYFSLIEDGDSLVINGRGYGHGVGLCQEGAMVMASKGFDYRRIINFYYKNVRIADISEATGEERERSIPVNSR